MVLLAVIPLPVVLSPRSYIIVQLVNNVWASLLPKSALIIGGTSLLTQRYVIRERVVAFQETHNSHKSGMSKICHKSPAYF